MVRFIKGRTAMEKKTITIVVPTYNEQENIPLIYQRVSGIFADKLPDYQMEMLYIDNCSTDASRERILDLAEKDKRVKAIFNAKNFGFTRSSF